MQYIPNQPVSFSQDPTYYLGATSCDGDEIVYNQLVDNAESVQFQMNIEPCESAPELFMNPVFADTDGWDIVANWSFGSGTLCATGATATLYGQDLLPEGYLRIKVVVSTMTEGGIEIWSDYLAELLYTITSVGTYYFYYEVPAGSGGDYLYIETIGTTTCCMTEFSGQSIDITSTINIFDSEENTVATFDYDTNPEYFVFYENTMTVTINWAALAAIDGCYFISVSDPCGGAQFISNMFKIGAYADKCTMLINSCCNNDAMGFAFGASGFIPRVRVEAYLKNATYTYERNVFENSDGLKSPYYFSRKKLKSLKVELQPEYIHDYLSTLAGYDNVFVNDVQYFVEDNEYNAIYSAGLSNFATVDILISETTQNVKNILCTDNLNSCNLAE